MVDYSTRWSVVEGAVQGRPDARREFVRRYERVVRAYLGARWRNSPLHQEIDDATQEVFLRCFQPDGILGRTERERPGGFRAFLLGAVRNVARNAERKRVRRHDLPGTDPTRVDRIAAEEDGFSAVFDREWARAILTEAVAYQAERAHEAGDEAEKRVELLRLRFQEDMPIREIARFWQADPAWVHHEYAKARREFQTALEEVVRFHHPGSREEARREYASILETVQ